MLLDQGVGAHHAQTAYVAVGAWWTEVSQEIDVPDPVAIEFSMTIARTCDRILKV